MVLTKDILFQLTPRQNGYFMPYYIHWVSEYLHQWLDQDKSITPGDKMIAATIFI